jgi:hypothetical protein
MSYQDSFLFKSAVMFTLFCTVIFFSSADFIYAQTDKLTIPAGTPVSITINQIVSSKTAPIGSKILASVANDVVINGKVVIKAGAPCNVSVLTSKKAGIVGSPGSITISVNNVQAIDGTIIPIINAVHSDEGKSQVITAIAITILCCILGLLIKGKEGEIPSGTQISGYTVSQVEIKI